jgi:hypothetical protein
MSDSPAWEYSVYTSGSALKREPDADLESALNDMGEQGWEVVAAVPIEGSFKIRYILKRPLSVSVRRERSMPGIS